MRADMGEIKADGPAVKESAMIIEHDRLISDLERMPGCGSLRLQKLMESQLSKGCHALPKQNSSQSAAKSLGLPRRFRLRAQRLTPSEQSANMRHAPRHRTR